MLIIISFVYYPQYLQKGNEANISWDVWRMTSMGLKLYHQGKVVKENFIKLEPLFYDVNNQLIWVDIHKDNLNIDTVGAYFYQLPDGKGEFYICNPALFTFDE